MGAEAPGTLVIGDAGTPGKAFWEFWGLGFREFWGALLSFFAARARSSCFWLRGDDAIRLPASRD